MRILSRVTSAAMMSLISTGSLSAQDACIGPGRAFGVVAYQCGDCTMRQKEGDPHHPIWQFGAEPLVLKATDGSALQSGDIIEAVNGKPITTAAGTRLFTYPPPRSDAELTVRRGGRQLTVYARASACADQTDESPVAPSPSTSDASNATKPHGRFGFAIACSNCTRQTRADGSAFWSFASNPVIGDTDPDGPAARAGLRRGDVIVAVDGHSLLDDAGARALGQVDRASSLRVTVERPDHTRTTVELRPRRSKSD